MLADSNAFDTTSYKHHVRYALKKLPRSLVSWIYTKIRRPILGFEQKRNPDGSFYTFEQQLKTTREQLILMALRYFEKGVSLTRIERMFSYYT